MVRKMFLLRVCIPEAYTAPTLLPVKSEKEK